MSTAPIRPEFSSAQDRRLSRERSARKQAETLLSEKSRELYQTLQHSQRLQQTLQLALWASGDAIWEWSRSSGTVRIERFFDDGQRSQVHEEPLEDLLLRIDLRERAAVEVALDALHRGHRDEIDSTYRLIPEQPGGDPLWRRIHGRAVERDEAGQPLRCLGTLKDITQQRRSEHSLRLLGHAFESNRDGLAVIDASWRVLEANEALSAMLGSAGRPLVGTNARDFIDQSMLDLGELQRDGSMQCELWLTRQNGDALPAELVISQLGTGPGQGHLFVVSVRDISDRHRSAKRLERLALFDPLTGLPNRTSLERQIESCLPKAGCDRQLALLFLDIDSFKTVNDGLGHGAGDELLIEVALRLKGWVGPNDYVARWGGDEFCVLARGENARERAEKLCKRLLDVLSEPMDIKGHRLRVTASIGIALAPEHADSVDLLLKLADSAMYLAKRRGRAGYAFHQGDRDSAGLRELELLGALRHDLEHQRLRMAAQGKVDCAGQLVGYETLIRWQNENLGQVSPAEFIPLAERNGLIGRIGALTIDQSLAFAAALQARGLSHTVAINLSPHQLNDAATIEQLRRACRRHQVSPQQINLEITESAVIDDPEVARSTLQAFRSEGFGIALDDFGIGYSSLAYLRLLPLDKVKIDRSFITDAADQPQARALLTGIIGLCHALGFKVVAEGVETQAQAALLRQMQVDEMQGFLFHRPRMVDELIAALDQD